jgi:hypothetical protein
VRHAGGAIVRLDRRGWLGERASLFMRPMQVAIDDVVVYQAADRIQIFATVTREQRKRRTAAVEDLVLVAGQLVYEELLPPRAPPAALVPPPREGYGYDRAPTLAAMRAAPIGDGAALVVETTRALPAIDLVVTATALDAVTGRVGAARVVGKLAPDDPLAALTGAPVVVLDRTLAERCRGTLGAVTVRAAGPLPAPVADADVAAATWALGRYVVAAQVDAPCTGAFVRGPDGAPVTFAIEHNQEIPVAILKAIGKALAETGASVDVAAELGPTRAAGYALYSLAQARTCDTPAVSARVLYRALRAGGKWDLARVAELAGPDPSMLITDLDGDGTLDAILAGAGFLGGRLDLRDPVIALPWPAGLRCRP